MNTKLKRLLRVDETETIEFKEQLNDSFFKTVCAFANTKGGKVILGVDNKGNVVGVETSTKFLENLTNGIVNKLSIYPEIETLEIEGRRVLIIHVTRAGYPVSYDGRYYERVGSTTREMSIQKLRAFMLSSIPWDSLTGEFSFNDIDEETVKLFVRMAVTKKRLSDVSIDEPVKTVLKKLALISNGKLTNGAILLFAKNPQKYFINLCVRIGRFKTETTIIDDKWIKGNLFNQLEETINIIKQLISVRYIIKGIQREDIWDYPLEAIREAIVNALVHRDYTNIANFILIKVYDDHIWFYNPGQLPEGITIEQLKTSHPSVIRNPLIAKIFYLCGFIEQYGTGTVKMVEWMKSAGLPEPEYREEMGGFSVYFYKDIYTEENLRKMGLNEKQIQAVMYVKEKGKITNKEYQKLVNVTKRTASRNLMFLAEKGIFQQIGNTGKGTYYILKGQKGHKGDKGDIKGTQRGQMGSKGTIKGQTETKSEKLT